MRNAQLSRRSAETEISVRLELDGAGSYAVDTGCGFFDHMLELFARHGGFDLELQCRGDMKTGAHHTVEDCELVLGGAFRQALGDRTGIARYGSAVIPMDEALVLAAADISGRPYAVCALEIPCERIGDFETELVSEFLWALARSLGASLHLRQFSGSNSHHIVEAAFKALGRALAQAAAADPKNAGRVPSTKGLLDG